MTRLLAVSIAAAALVACGDVDRLEDAVCPTGGTSLTYAGFGEPFLAAHCQRCHASGAADRDGAPGEVAFDTRAQVVEHADRIYARAAAGNTSMPPGPDGPSEAERQLLSEWLACGAP